MSTFTIDNTREADEKILSDLSVIEKVLLGNLTDVSALILVGGFGRGEGGVVFENDVPMPINDYDIVIVSQNKCGLRLKKLSKEIANETGVRLIDLIQVNNADVPTLPYTMFNYDMKSGGYLFWGDEDILRKIPDYDPSGMPLIEGRILLFNRMICLLESYSEEFMEREPDEDEKFFLTNQSSKAILACCDSLLISKGLYHHSYIERCKRFSETFKDREKVVALVKQATDFKLKPKAMTDFDAAEYWFDAREVFVNVLLEFCEIYYGRKLGDLEVLEKLYKKEGISLKRRVANIVGLINNAGPRKDIELLELGLLYAVNRESYVDKYSEFAKSKLNEISKQEYPDGIGWEFMRKECVRLWFKYLH